MSVLPTALPSPPRGYRKNFLSFPFGISKFYLSFKACSKSSMYPPWLHNSPQISSVTLRDTDLMIHCRNTLGKRPSTSQPPRPCTLWASRLFTSSLPLTQWAPSHSGRNCLQFPTRPCSCTFQELSTLGLAFLPDMFFLSCSHHLPFID